MSVFLFCYVVNQIKDLFFRPTDRQKILFKSLNVFVTQTRHFKIHPFHLPKFNCSALQPRELLVPPGVCWRTYAPTNHAIALSVSYNRVEQYEFGFKENRKLNFIVSFCCGEVLLPHFLSVARFSPKNVRNLAKKISSLRMSFSSMLHPWANTSLCNKSCNQIVAEQKVFPSFFVPLKKFLWRKQDVRELFTNSC